TGRNIAVTTRGSVNTSKVGTYTITYSAKDSTGKSASKKRTVIVEKVVVNEPNPTICTKSKPWDCGNLVVSQDKKSLQHADGSDFFWMADTAWDMYRISAEDIDFFMSNRANKKFTVIQATAIHAHWSTNSSSEHPFYNSDFKQINEEYWQHIDYMIDSAANQGLYVALLPTWHSAVRYETLKNPAEARQYGEWLANRYKNKSNIIWVIGGDTPIDASRVPSGMTVDEEVAIWNAMGSGINSIATNHLMTFHPLGTIPSIRLNNPSWLDFNMLQSGRSSTSHSVKHVQKALSEGLAVIDGESLYENLAFGNKGESDRRTAYQVRDDAYSQIFAGAFGNTYGHSSIYRFWVSTAPVKCSGWICTPNMTWLEALDAPGATQMRFVTELMKSRPLRGRTADQSIIVGTPQASNLEGFVATKGTGYAMVYTSHGKDIAVDLRKLSGTKTKAWWYNPRNGNTTEIGEFNNNATHIFNPPGEPSKVPSNVNIRIQQGNDWVLVLDDMSKNFGKPGQ
ncbi:MAG: DUF4038 domain-containing protein, partial [Sulfurovum sp.]|nr:DUF4038 domain-containing protein [Sulfurovum sp.]